MFKTLRTIIVALAVTASGTLPAMATEEPVFTLVKKDGSFEIRDYAPVIVAETTLTGSAERARNAGFQPLADYIFAKDRKGSTIAMTAPVTQSSAGDSWTISFTMPASYTMEKLPTPVNPNVRLVPQAARRMGVVRFSGTASADSMDKMRIELINRVKALGLQTVGEPVFAFYDPPWTLPFFRRNEVMVELGRR
jgi:hypothetical protein